MANLLTKFLQSLRKPVAAKVARLSYSSEDEIIQFYSQKIVENPNDVGLRLARGMAFGRAGQHEAAIAELNDVLQRDPMRIETLYYRGGSYLVLHHFEKALEDFTELINECANRVPPMPFDHEYFDFGHLMRGQTYIHMGEIVRARVDLNKGIAKMPDYALGYVLRAYCALLSLDLEEALVDLRHAETLDAYERTTWLYLGVVELQRGEFQTAKAYFQRALADEEWDDPYSNLALLSLKQNDLANASVYADKAIALNVQWSPLAFYVKGKVHLAGGDHEKAFADFANAIKYWTNPEAPLHKPYIDEMKAYLAQG